jgi:tetratricopeptide (TPR) repeat protein
MKNRSLILLFAVCCAVTFSGLCFGKDQNTDLTVKIIAFARDKGGSERIVLFCNQPCMPELSAIEEENPRVVLDMKGVVLIQTKARNVDTGGRLVKRIRSYLDKQTSILRVVLDMDPSKYYLVCPVRGPSGNTYALSIRERTSPSGQKPGGDEEAEDSRLPQEKHIHIVRPDQRPGEKNKPREAAPGQEKSGVAKPGKDLPSVDQGRAQLNAGEFSAAVETFTEILVAHPRDSLVYRLRGNAYDNLGDRQKAVEDWTQAARLGDAALQSYLDFLQIMWRDNPTR